MSSETDAPPSVITDEVVTGKRGASAKKRWTPKEWRPEYTAIVALSCTGMSNEAVGKHFNYTKVHVSNILCQPEAVAIRKLLNEQLLKDAGNSIPDRLRRLQDMSLARMENFIARDDLAEKSPFQMFDRALKVLQGTNTLASPEAKTGATTNIQQNTFVLSDAAAKQLTEGLAKSQQVAVLHADVQPISIEPKKLTGLVSD